MSSLPLPLTEAAPFYHDVAEGPAAQAFWVRASDGLRLRVCLWAGGDAGTVLIFNGRTECCEKYGRTAADFVARGFAVATLDWRGQGLADRQASDRQLGHVLRFSDYQHDVAALMSAVRAANLPEPYYLIGHSMGGCIGLRALHNELPVKAAFFGAPMWGIGLSSAMRPTAWAVSWAATQLGLGARYAPGRSSETYLLAEPFAGNDLTTDADMFAYMQEQVRRYPDLGLGGPSLRWVYEALVEMRDLMAMPPPPVPVLTGLGSNERIVDPAPIKRYMPGWAQGRLRVVDGAEHELLMETPATRAALTEEIVALFLANG